MNWHNFENKQILGTVPVERDGSVHLEVPSGTYVYFQLLDADGMMVQSMRTGVVFQPGERVSCTGCHDDPLSAPPPRIDPLNPTLALRRAPSRLGGWHGPPGRSATWPRCSRCGTGTASRVTISALAAKLNLAGDRDLFFNASYEALHQRLLPTAISAPSVPAPRRPGSPAIGGRVPARWSHSCARAITTFASMPRSGTAWSRGST